MGISGKDDEVTALARDEQDNPPYSLDNNGDHTDPVLATRLMIGPSAGVIATEVIDIPLGIFELKCMNAYIDEGANLTQGMNVKVELLGMYEM